ncbi:hypothetical protein HI914_03627 [Erysiphe necator]|nr:hypothetical protein HI914_03627 [Erysiphe necator]
MRAKKLVNAELDWPLVDTLHPSSIDELNSYGKTQENPTLTRKHVYIKLKASEEGYGTILYHKQEIN